jgi:pimeloyl-ACP methyl ester carboxylesterase
VVAPDLPSDDDSAGLAKYADVVVDAIGNRSGVIIVAQSMAGYTAPMVCDRVAVDMIVMLAAMTPAPGETPGEWWENTGQVRAKRELDDREGRPVDAPFDPLVTFFHDVPPDVVSAAMARGTRHMSGTPFGQPWPMAAWPDVPTRFLLCRDDRLFPAGFQRRIVKQRLGITPDEMDGGHLPAFGHPDELVGRLEAYRREILPPR